MPQPDWTRHLRQAQRRDRYARTHSRVDRRRTRPHNPRRDTHAYSGASRRRSPSSPRRSAPKASMSSLDTSSKSASLIRRTGTSGATSNDCGARSSRCSSYSSLKPRGKYTVRPAGVASSLMLGALPSTAIASFSSRVPMPVAANGRVNEHHTNPAERVAVADRRDRTHDATAVADCDPGAIGIDREKTLPVCRCLIPVRRATQAETRGNILATHGSHVHSG